MIRRWFQVIMMRPWARIGLAAALIIAGLAPVGAPILSDNSWRRLPAQAEAAAGVAAPFMYQANVLGESTQVLRSDDGGQTWHAVASIPQPVAQVEAVRGQEETVLARGAALWISHDGGASWAQTTALPSRPLSLAVGDKESGVIFAGTESIGLLLSRDLGATWQPVEDATLADGGTAPLAVTALTVDTADSQIVYAATGIWLGTSHTRLTPVGVFVSVDGGRRWLEMERLPLAASPITRLSALDGRPLAVTAADATGSHAVTLKLTPELLAQLDSADAGLRASAASALGLIGHAAALPALVGHLEDSDALAGDQIAAAIGRLGDSSTVPVLMEALMSEDEAIRARSAYALGLLKAEAAVPQLAQALRADSPLVARRAAEALAAIGTEPAMKALAAPLADGTLTPARHAAMTGIELAGPQAVPTLTAALGADQAAVRANSAEMLGWLRAAQATPALAKALTDADPAVRNQAAWALGEVATPEARQALAAAIDGQTDATVRQATTAALARAETLAGGERLAETSFWSGLMEAVTAIPAGRWTLLGLFVVMAAALLLAGPRRTHLPHG
jgi:HEAT repeat protein